MYVFEKGFLHVVYNLCGPISCLYLLSIRVATVYYHSKKSSFMLRKLIIFLMEEEFYALKFLLLSRKQNCRVHTYPGLECCLRPW